MGLGKCTNTISANEATRASIIENTQQEDLTQYETVRSVKMWYDVLCEELPQENGEGRFESPIEEGKTFDSRKAIKNYHIQQGDIEKGGSDKLSKPLVNQTDVIEKISNQSPYNKKTVKRLIRLGKLPHKILILLKTHIQMNEGSRKLRDPLVDEEDVKKKISEQSPYSYDTVKRLIRLGKLPHKILILLKTHIQMNEGSDKRLRTIIFNKEILKRGVRETFTNPPLLRVMLLNETTGRNGDSSI